MSGAGSDLLQLAEIARDRSPQGRARLFGVLAGLCCDRWARLTVRERDLLAELLAVLLPRAEPADRNRLERHLAEVAEIDAAAVPACLKSLVPPASPALPAASSPTPLPEPAPEPPADALLSATVLSAAPLPVVSPPVAPPPILPPVTVSPPIFRSSPILPPVTVSPPVFRSSPILPPVTVSPPVFRASPIRITIRQTVAPTVPQTPAKSLSEAAPAPSSSPSDMQSPDSRQQHRQRLRVSILPRVTPDPPPPAGMEEAKPELAPTALAPIAAPIPTLTPAPVEAAVPGRHIEPMADQVEVQPVTPAALTTSSPPLPMTPDSLPAADMGEVTRESAAAVPILIPAAAPTEAALPDRQAEPAAGQVEELPVTPAVLTASPSLLPMTPESLPAADMGEVAPESVTAAPILTPAPILMPALPLTLASVEAVLPDRQVGPMEDQLEVLPITPVTLTTLPMTSDPLPAAGIDEATPESVAAVPILTPAPAPILMPAPPLTLAPVEAVLPDHQVEPVEDQVEVLPVTSVAPTTLPMRSDPLPAAGVDEATPESVAAVPILTPAPILMPAPPLTLAPVEAVLPDHQVEPVEDQVEVLPVTSMALTTLPMMSDPLPAAEVDEAIPETMAVALTPIPALILMPALVPVEAALPGRHMEPTENRVEASPVAPVALITFPLPLPTAMPKPVSARFAPAVESGLDEILAQVLAMPRDDAHAGNSRGGNLRGDYLRGDNLRGDNAHGRNSRGDIRPRDNPHRLTPDQLEAALEQDDLPRYEAMLAHMCNIRAPLLRRLLQQAGGESLAILARAAGFQRGDFLRQWGRWRRQAGRLGQVKAGLTDRDAHQIDAFFTALTDPQVDRLMQRWRNDDARLFTEAESHMRQAMAFD